VNHGRAWIILDIPHSARNALLGANDLVRRCSGSEWLDPAFASRIYGSRGCQWTPRAIRFGARGACLRNFDNGGCAKEAEW